MTAGFWNRIKAGWYQKGLKYSSFPKIAMPLCFQRQALQDIPRLGSGCGTLAIPLAKAGEK